MSEQVEDNAPRPIRRLDEALVNRIAAGEIIHRPSSALKELLENALDAGSTSIQLLANDGGMKLLQLRDNGSGIRRDDLEILAERFTTSKISKFEDLQSLDSYGFRGEALASISFVSQLSVITKTKAEPHAWKASYSDGKLVPAKPGQTVEPKPSAGTDGTIITVENLFYNSPVRLAALKNKSDEYSRLLDVMTKYALHRPTVALTCRKSTSTQPDLNTPGGTNTSTLDNVRRLFGATVAESLIDMASVNDEEVEDMIWRYSALCSTASYASKAFKFILFINGRLVESNPLRRAIESVYAPILAKGTHPFVYLSLSISPECLDVNVHPTKREVRFLHEDEVIAHFTEALGHKLSEQARSRPFTLSQRPTHSRIKDVADMDVDEEVPGEDEDAADSSDKGEDHNARATKDKPSKLYSQHKVRTSKKDRVLDSMVYLASSSSRNDLDQVTLSSAIPISQCAFTSIQNLRAAVKDNAHRKLKDILEDHTFVSLVDAPRGLSLVQHATRLYMLNHAILSEELFYQLALRQFPTYSRIGLKPSPSLRRLLRIALEAEFARRPEAGKHNSEVLENKIFNLLVARRNLLDVHFCMRINADGELETLPRLLPGYVPDMTKLPMLVMRLGPQVDWSDEEQCFSGIMRELAVFYSLSPVTRNSRPGSVEDKSLAWQVQHVILDRARSEVFDPPASLLDSGVVEVANLPQLYKVFERC